MAGHVWQSYALSVPYGNKMLAERIGIDGARNLLPHSHSLFHHIVSYDAILLSSDKRRHTHSAWKVHNLYSN